LSFEETWLKVKGSWRCFQDLIWLNRTKANLSGYWVSLRSKWCLIPREISHLRALSCKSPRPGTPGPPAPVRLSGRPQEREIQGRGCPGRVNQRQGHPQEGRSRSRSGRVHTQTVGVLLSPTHWVVITRLSLVPPWKRWGQGPRLFGQPAWSLVWSSNPWA